ncbi:MAG: type II and III secretion system protein family protein [Roseobacter sp.]
MKIYGTLKTALIGLGFSVNALAFMAPVTAHAETLRIIAQDTNEQLDVAQNRAVVVESEIPFAELSIANPGIADISSLSDRTIYVLGKIPGITTLTLLDATGQLITNVEVRVAPDLTEFKERLRQILPGEQIEVRTANDGIVLSGQVSSSQRLTKALELATRYAPDRVSNLMTVGGVQQVMLKVRFAEMSRGVSKSLQSSLSLGGTDVSGITGPNGVELGNGTTVNINEPSGALLFGFGVGSVQVGLLLEALETKGAVRTLAEPNLVALSGQEANFLAGGEFPVPTQSDDGIGIEFKPFGIELNFVPRVVDGDLINLQLSAATSSIDASNGVTLDGGLTVNAFVRRETSTTVEIRDGQSFAIAGLLEDSFNDTVAQVPWIGDVPILGALFRSTDYARNQTELVIIVTAYLVSPTQGDALALPTDRIKPPSEADLFLNGHTVKTLNAAGAAGEVAKQDFSGSYGYVME